MKKLFTELEFYQTRKATEYTPGDAFMMHKDTQSGRLIAVLSDGLGSGVKANILANMTARMAIRFAESNTDFLHYAKIIMNALPVCRVRKIAYATFTVVDYHNDGTVQIVEQGSPPFILIRRGVSVDIPSTEYRNGPDDYRKLNVYHFTAQPEDRIIFFSDGVTESGMGSHGYPLGWRRKSCAEFIEKRISNERALSARETAQLIVTEALHKEPDRKAYDDISCAVLYLRQPRCTILASGPPFSEVRDAEYTETIRSFNGSKIICGGTSADIVARELKRPIQTDLFYFRTSTLPPISTMEGIDLITEGILTLTETLNLLEEKKVMRTENAATLLAERLRNSDEIHFLIGTKINQAHQDPSLPIELKIRRSLMRRIATTLEERYFKEVTLEFI